MENNIQKPQAHLELPREEYKESFLEGLLEFHNEKLFLKWDYKDLKDNFEEFLDKFGKQSKGIDIDEGKVPQTMYWIIDNNEYIGNVILRHKLNEKLEDVGGNIGYQIRPSKRKKGYGDKALAMVLPKARSLGLDKVLLTCDKENIGSVKIIEKNGGNLASEGINQENGKEILRYWIDI